MHIHDHSIIQIDYIVLPDLTVYPPDVSDILVIFPKNGSSGSKEAGQTASLLYNLLSSPKATE